VKHITACCKATYNYEILEQPAEESASYLPACLSTCYHQDHSQNAYRTLSLFPCGPSRLSPFLYTGPRSESFSVHASSVLRPTYSLLAAWVMFSTTSRASAMKSCTPVPCIGMTNGIVTCKCMPTWNGSTCTLTVIM